MTAKILIDTGPIIAFIFQHDKHHHWVKQQLAKINPPLFTCEAVISEACFLLKKSAQPRDAISALFEFIDRELIQIDFQLNSEIKAIKRLIKRYYDVPMSLADACLVRMSEQSSDAKILTFDSDFKIYRRHERQVINVITPA